MQLNGMKISSRDKENTLHDLWHLNQRIQNNKCSTLLEKEQKEKDTEEYNRKYHYFCQEMDASAKCIINGINKK